MESALLHYQQRLQQIQSSIGAMQSRQLLSTMVFSAAILVFLALSFAALSRRTIPVWSSPLSLPFVLLSARKYGRQQASQLKLARLQNFYRLGLNRLQGKWAGQGQSGEEFSIPNHIYERDLNLFGTGSLFQRLCTTRTHVGSQRLANYLLDASISMDECLARQAAVQELQSNTHLREQVATLGKTFNQSTWETFATWLSQEPTKFAPWMRLFAAFTSLATGVILLIVITGHVSWELAIPLIAIQAAFGWALRPRVLHVIQHTRFVSIEIGLIREGLALLATQNFQSAKLKELTRKATSEQSATEILQLERYLETLDQRQKDWFYGPFLLLLVATQCAMAIEAWRIRNGSNLKNWVEAWAEFDALSAIACYAFECRQDTFPEFVEGPATYEAVGLGHPLLQPEMCVRNDVKLHSQSTRLLVISGSNMSGKSTLLRAVGINAVLAAAGAPVRARSLRLSLFATCASLSIQDSILEGKSKFMAELERLRETIRLSKEQIPVLFLIDEIFSGTNSHDRRIAAEAVVRTLIAAGAVGAISTHDLALTEIADLPLMQGSNWHMGSKDASNPLDFDYLLKPGITTESNALAIARLAGVAL